MFKVLVMPVIVRQDLHDLHVFWWWFAIISSYIAIKRYSKKAYLPVNHIVKDKANKFS